MLSAITDWFKSIFNGESQAHKAPVRSLSDEQIQFLEHTVAFYRNLSEADKRTFEQRALLFLQTTEVVGNGVEVSDEDCLLVAASAIIPVWAFKGWHYFNLTKVILVPAAFNKDMVLDAPDSTITGMVGSGPLTNRMVLSRPALHYGFINAHDKKNVGIHEFVHLIDMADGDCDGFPERLSQYSYFAPWSRFVEKKITEIHTKRSNIDSYGATNPQEFFAVASEYFFEEPKLLKRKHPHLYSQLMAFYHQDLAAIKADIEPRKNGPCPCGSGKKYKRCCMPKA